MDAIFDKNTTIIFDTSFWLDIYRNLPDTIETITTALNKEDFVNRIFIPSFVSKEFQKHKNKLILEHKNIITKVSEALSIAINEGKKSILNAIGIQKNRYKIENDIIENNIKKSLEEIEKNGGKFLSPITENRKEDSYLDVEKLFDKIKLNNTINILSSDDIFNIFIEGESRFKQQIPPGFMDKEKEIKGGFIYGDLIIWKEIIGFAKSEKKNVLFVTNDTKKDWFDENDEFNTKLIEEFKSETGKNITGINTKTFYEHTSINKGIDIVSFINIVFGDLFQKIYDEINNSDKNRIFDPYEILSSYSGDYYELEDISEFEQEDYKIHFEDDVIEIKIYIKFKAIIKTAGYSGRDEDTKEVYLYPYYTHEIGGTIEVTIEKQINELFYNKTNYEIVDLFSNNCKELKYETDSDNDCDDYDS